MRLDKLEENIIYEYLRKLFVKKTKADEYVIYNNIRYVEISTKTLKEEFGISPFKQRNILDSLAKQNNISIKLGQARKRYFSIDKSGMVDILHIKENVLRKIKAISDKRLLEKISKLLESEG